MRNRGIILAGGVMVSMAIAVLAYASASRVFTHGDTLFFRDGSGNELKVTAASSITPATLTQSAGSGALATTDGIEIFTNKTLTSPTITDATITMGMTDAKVLIGNSAGTGVEQGVSLTGDVTGTMTSSGVINATHVARYGELSFHNHDSPLVVTLTATTLANVTGMDAGLSSDMIVNATNGSITVSTTGIYFAIASMSVLDPDSNSEEYNSTFGNNGTPSEKCEWHRDITVLSKEGSATMSCLQPLSAGDIATVIVNSAGGDDLGIQVMNFTMFKL